MGLWGSIKKGARKVGGVVKKIPGVSVASSLLTGSGLDRSKNQFSAVDPSGGMGAQVGRASDMSELGIRDYMAQNRNLDQVVGQLWGNQAQGKNLVSTEQLRQGLQQNLAAQQSMAASAAPQNQAMAQRTAMIQGARAASGMSGQAALAALQERDAAQKLVADIRLQQQRAGLQAALDSRAQAIQGEGTLENARAERFKGMMGAPTQGESLLNAGMGIAGIAAMASDRKLKKNIRDADGDVEDFMKGLKAYKYDYKDEKFGEGKRLGIMAQDLEKTKLGKRAVIDTDEGKMVDVRTLAGALAASTANLNKRLAKVEAGAR